LGDLYLADIHKGIPFMTWTVKTGALLIAQIHGFEINEDIDSGSSKNLYLLAIISTILIIN
jgi:hypothetical protein